jgi:hypothetical protein
MYCRPMTSSWWPHLCTIRPNFTSILRIFCTFIWLECFGTYKLRTLDLYWHLLVRSDPARVFPIRTDCITIFLNVVDKGGTVRWNWHITPDLCLATSWLHDLIYYIVHCMVVGPCILVPWETFIQPTSVGTIDLFHSSVIALLSKVLELVHVL